MTDNEIKKNDILKFILIFLAFQIVIFMLACDHDTERNELEKEKLKLEIKSLRIKGE